MTDLKVILKFQNNSGNFVNQQDELENVKIITFVPDSPIQIKYSDFGGDIYELILISADDTNISTSGSNVFHLYNIIKQMINEGYELFTVKIVMGGEENNSDKSYYQFSIPNSDDSQKIYSDCHINISVKENGEMIRECSINFHKHE